MKSTLVSKRHNLSKTSKSCQFQRRFRPFSISRLSILTVIGRPWGQSEGLGV